jgi:hypothetical protein
MKIKDPDDLFIDPIIQYDKKYPDRRLYLAIIFKALTDTIKKKSDADKNRAIGWFKCSVGVTCSNFEFICDCAGLDPSYVRSFAYEVINSKDPKSFRDKINRYKRIIAKEEKENERG